MSAIVAGSGVTVGGTGAPAKIGKHAAMPTPSLNKFRSRLFIYVCSCLKSRLSREHLYSSYHDAPRRVQRRMLAKYQSERTRPVRFESRACCFE
jgi:hypothetical protein